MVSYGFPMGFPWFPCGFPNNGVPMSLAGAVPGALDAGDLPPSGSAEEPGARSAPGPGLAGGGEPAGISRGELTGSNLLFPFWSSRGAKR